MNYKFLPDQLHATADQVAAYLAETRGVTAIKPEEQVKKELEYRPTIQGLTTDKYVVAIEVQDNPDTTHLDPVILQCVTQRIPIKLFIAFPQSTTPIPHNLIEKAHKKGLGVIEVEQQGPQVLREALPLSLLGYRLDPMKFPKKMRNTLIEAGNTFRDGAPAKGCSIVYDEIEALSRKIVKKTKQKKLWRKLKQNEKMPNLSLDDGPWEKVIELFQHFYIVNKKKVPKLTANLIHRVAAVTSYRNDSGHKKADKDRMKRDEEIRTRFESAGDLLLDLLEAETQLR